jgi:hypothetical protein
MGRILIGIAIIAALAAGAFVYRRAHSDARLMNGHTCGETQVC